MLQNDGGAMNIWLIRLGGRWYSNRSRNPLFTLLSRGEL